MKNLFLILILVCAVSGLHAQEKPANSAPSKIEKNINFEKWSKELELTETQKTQILEIKSKFKNEITNARKTGMNREAQNALWTQQKNEIKKILTSEQLAKANLLNKKNKERKSQDVSNSSNK